jgi:glutaminase
MYYKEIIKDIYEIIINQEDHGHLADYIPELAKVKPENFGIHLSSLNMGDSGIGDFNIKFSVQSIIKVLSLSLAYHTLGESIWERVDVEPSGTPFNSLIQLEADKGIPRNPFINAGALVICDILISQLANPVEDFLSYIRDLAGNQDIDYSDSIQQSEKSVGYRNIALCNFIKSFGNIENDPDVVLDFYFKICSIEMSCFELSKTFLFLANKGICPQNNKKFITSSQAKRINAIMQTCGFYDESGEFAFKVGLPGKSGVGGGIIAILPNEYSIATWSPQLNEKGNSYRGMRFLELLTTRTESSIF